MKMYDLPTGSCSEQTSEYTVEFQCASTFLVNFKDTEGLTKHQIIQKAIEVANQTFVGGGTLSVERSSSQGYYLFTVAGIDRSSGQVLGTQTPEKPMLRLVK